MDAVSAPAPRLSRPAMAVAHALIPADRYAELEAAAARRGEHVDALTAQLVTAAILLDRVDSLIDDAVRMLRSRR